MKALNLKSMSWIVALAMMFIVSFTGCSDDNDETENGGGKVEFPALQETTLNADGTLQISFKANADWKLTSTAGWCKFVNGDFTESTISGKAGEQTITAKISGDGQNYADDHVAEIKLAMSGKEEVIYKITRPKKEFKGLTIKDEEGNIYNAENPIIIKGSGINDIVYTSIIAETESNFEVGINPENNPNWITITSKEAGKFSMTFNKDNKEKLNYINSLDKEKGYSITFSVQTNEGLANVAIPVVYEGLKEGELSITTQFFNAKVSLDGKKIVSSDATGSNSQLYKNQITTSIITRNDDYEIVKFEQKGHYEGGEWTPLTYYIDSYIFENGNMNWAHENKNNSELSLTFDTFTPEEIEFPTSKASRAIVIMAFPRNKYNEIKDDLKGHIIEKVEVEEYGDIVIKESMKSIYDPYIVAIVVQEDIKTSFEAGIVTDYGYSSFKALGLSENAPEFKNYEGEPIEGAGTDNIYEIIITNNLAFGNDSKATAINIVNGEALTAEVKSSTLGNKITMTTPAEGLPTEYGGLDGKQYIVLTPATEHDATITGTIQIAVKSGSNVEALLIVKFTAAEPAQLSKLKSRK